MVAPHDARSPTHSRGLAASGSTMSDLHPRLDASAQIAASCGTKEPPSSRSNGASSIRRGAPATAESDILKELRMRLDLGRRTLVLADRPDVEPHSLSLEDRHLALGPEHRVDHVGEIEVAFGNQLDHVRVVHVDPHADVEAHRRLLDVLGDEAIA